MARAHASMKRYLLLSTLALFATTAIAQTTNTAETSADATTAAAATTSPTTAATTATTAKTTATTEAADDTTADSAATTVPNLTSSTTTPTTSADTTAATGTNPTDLPTLSTTGVTSYPSPSVPPTSNAPYMQTSNMPEGTVFIAVGAILGAFGAAVLIWRAVVACLLHRSVKRAALAQHLANDKMAVPGAPTAPFYKYTDHESQGSLGAAAAAASGRGVRRTSRVPIPSATPSQSNLFFSPTATNPGNMAGNRSSAFLPSGFYAAGQGTPQQGHGHSISMTDLRPESRGSPGVTPRNDTMRRHPQMSTSTLNLNQAPTGRAPSMFLDDLLDENPQQMPPSGGYHAHNQSRDRF